MNIWSQIGHTLIIEANSGDRKAFVPALIKGISFLFHEICVPNGAQKGIPRSASKRDFLFGYDVGLLKWLLRCARRRAGVARPEARAAQDRFLKAPKVAVSCGF